MHIPRSFSHKTKMSDIHVCASFFKPLIRRKQPNTIAKRLGTLAKRPVDEPNQLTSHSPLSCALGWEVSLPSKETVAPPVPDPANLWNKKKPEPLETLGLRYFGISRELRTSRSHVTMALPAGLWFEVHVCTAGPGSRNKWFIRKVFCILKHHNPTIENNLIDYWLSNVILKTISQLK